MNQRNRQVVHFPAAEILSERAGDRSGAGKLPANAVN